MRDPVLGRPGILVSVSILCSSLEFLSRSSCGSAGGVSLSNYTSESGSRAKSDLECLRAFNDISRAEVSHRPSGFTQGTLIHRNIMQSLTMSLSEQCALILLITYHRLHAVNELKDDLNTRIHY